MEPRAATAKTPTCATPAEWLPRARGFTLIELVVALALAALMVALVPPALEKLRDGMHYRDTVRAIVTELRAARQRSRTEGAEVRFFVDLGGRRFGLDETTMRPVPQPLQMRVTVAGIEWRAEQVGAIRFLPQGGATGGSVDILRPAGGGVRITVDWLSAAVSQTPIER